LLLRTLPEQFLPETFRWFSDRTCREKTHSLFNEVTMDETSYQIFSSQLDVPLLVPHSIFSFPLIR
jgi:hypothetical protein